METNPIIINDLEEIIKSNIAWDNLFGKTILISGANGFLASYIVKSLLFKNDTDLSNIKVIALVRNIDKAKERFKDYLGRNDLEIIVEDISKPLKVAHKIHFIVHAASQASPKYYGIDPVGTIEANTLGTYNLLQLARENKVTSFLYFSSGEVYGIIDEDKIPTKETDYGYVDPNNVRSCYAESKRMGENLCVSFHHQYQVPAKIIRPFHTYDPGMALDDGRVFSDFVSNIVNKKDIVLNSDGTAQRAFCYLSEATVAFFKVLLEGIDGEAYNVGNPDQELSILDLGKILINIRPEYNLNVCFNQKQDTESNYLKSPINRNSPNISKISQLGWYPKISIKEGFTRVVKSFEELTI